MNPQAVFDNTDCVDKTDAVEVDKADLEEDGFIYTDEADWESLYEHMPPEEEDSQFLQ